jgi:DNA-binding transcriptional MerR regulator/methylmalonyl-CoA mutase cobalamin-binding subunit
VPNISDREASAGYSIKAASQATGLTVETLRAWERRYGIIEPKRDVSGHRIYTACDVSRLRRLRETTDRGHPIGKIAHLSNEDLTCLLDDRDADHPHRNAAQMLVARILSSVERYLPEECDQSIAMAFALLPACEVIREVLSPALREVGERWRGGEFTIGQERIVSSAVRRHACSLLNTYNRVAKGATVVFATLSGERHELGILMYATIAASRALRVSYLGADLPAEEIGDYARRVNATAVAISVVSPDQVRTSLQQLAVLRQTLAAGVEIWIGGAALSSAEPAEFPAGIVHLSGYRDFEHRVDLLVAPSR